MMAIRRRQQLRSDSIVLQLIAALLATEPEPEDLQEQFEALASRLVLLHAPALPE
jgi:hypothetical protein